MIAWKEDFGIRYSLFVIGIYWSEGIITDGRVMDDLGFPAGEVDLSLKEIIYAIVAQLRGTSGYVYEVR